MQRLTKYPLLIDSILAQTADTSTVPEEIPLLKKALEKARSCLSVSQLCYVTSQHNGISIRLSTMQSKSMRTLNGLNSSSITLTRLQWPISWACTATSMSPLYADFTVLFSQLNMLRAGGNWSVRASWLYLKKETTPRVSWNLCLKINYLLIICSYPCNFALRHTAIGTVERSSVCAQAEFQERRSRHQQKSGRPSVERNHPPRRTVQESHHRH